MAMLRKSFLAFLGLLMCSQAAFAALSDDARKQVDCAAAYRLLSDALAQAKPPAGKTPDDMKQLAATFGEMSNASLGMAMETSTQDEAMQQAMVSGKKYHDEQMATNSIDGLLKAIGECKDSNIPAKK